MAKVDFLLIGAQKSGTTWLHTNLSKHPRIFVPNIKEVHFFNSYSNYEKGIDWYENIFDGSADDDIVGECTPDYFWVRQATRPKLMALSSDLPFSPPADHPDVIPNPPELVHNHYPNVKLILILRNPVNRAISAFLHHIRKRRFPPSSSILDVGHRFGILEMGFYHTNLLAWLDYFPSEQIEILIYEKNIAANRAKTLESVFSHLGVDSEYLPPHYKGRKYSSPTHLYTRINYYFPRLAKRFYSTLNKFNFFKIKVTESEREILYQLYENEINALEDLLDRPLLSWKPNA